MKLLKILVFLFIYSTNQLVFCWKPIIGQTYTRVTHHHPIVGTQNTIIESDVVSGSENSATYHGKAILDGFAGSSGSDELLSNAGIDGSQLTDDQPVLTVGDGQLDDSEGRVLGGISSHYDGKVLNGFISTASVSQDHLDLNCLRGAF